MRNTAPTEPWFAGELIPVVAETRKLCIPAKMARYFFHVDGSDDETGTELPNDAAARREAIATFGAMIRDGQMQVGGQMNVADAKGDIPALQLQVLCGRMIVPPPGATEATCSPASFVITTVRPLRRAISSAMRTAAPSSASSNDNKGRVRFSGISRSIAAKAGAHSGLSATDASDRAAAGDVLTLAQDRRRTESNLAGAASAGAAPPHLA